MKRFSKFVQESVELEEQSMSFQDAEKLKGKHLVAADRHKKSGNSKGYAAHTAVVSKFEDAYDRHGTGVIPAGRILSASQKAFKDHPHSSMKESIELDEAWSDGVSSRNAHTHRSAAAQYRKKANSFASMAKNHEKGSPEHNKHMSAYHSTMAKSIKSSYHAGDYGSMAIAKKDHKAEMARAKEYKSTNESIELDEAVTIKKKDYSWGKMMTVHHGSSHSFPLHPEHQEKIRKLESGQKTSFKDETGAHITAHRDGDTIHLKHPGSNKKTSVARSHFTESAELEEKLKASDDMGDWIKDFQDSDAPQFKGKSKEKRRQMAIAAKLNAERNEAVAESKEDLSQHSTEALKAYVKKVSGGVPAFGHGARLKRVHAELKRREKTANESVDLVEASTKVMIPKSRYLTILKAHGPKKLVRTPKGEMQYRGAEYFAHNKDTDTHITQTYSHPDHNIATIERHKHHPTGETRYYMYRKTQKEDVDLDEAVEVSHDRYMRSHGKKARDTGQSGNWMFTHKRMGDVNYNDDKEVHTARGKFADAKKSAQQWAKKHGHGTVYVMEEVEQIDEISASTLRSYVDKARVSRDTAKKDRTQAKSDMKKYGNMPGDRARHDAAQRKMANRAGGISVANKKLGTYPTDRAKAKVMARKEVDVNESAEMSLNQKRALEIGRKLQSMAPKEKNDMISNAMANLGDHLESFGATFGAKNMADLVKKTGLSKEIITTLIRRAQK
jgi:hypothetical protein